MPINRTTVNELYGLDLQAEEDMEQFLRSRAEPVDYIRSSEDVVVAKVGRELYEKFFRGYTRKQWQRDPSELHSSVCARIPIRTNGFSYQTEAVVKAVWSGLDFVQVGIEIKPRESGESKALTLKNLRIVLDAVLRLWWEVKVTDRGRYRRLGRMLGTF